jgi:hypothetical protein
MFPVCFPEGRSEVALSCPAVNRPQLTVSKLTTDSRATCAELSWVAQITRHRFGIWLSVRSVTHRPQWAEKGTDTVR